MPENRCPWAGSEKIYQDYHDFEWGRPVHDDRVLFEFLILEGMQAGLSWITVLKKRENFRRAFDGFDPKKVSLYKEKDTERLMADAGIIRNRLKIDAAVQNAKSFLAVQKEFGSFDRYIWSFTDGEPIVNSFSDTGEVPARTELSDKMSKDLKKRGFKFVGSTICYAFMQAVGMVNDHLTGCFCSSEV